MNVTKQVTGLSGVSAIFVLGFVNALDEGETKLRACQDAGLQLVKDLDGVISVPYISKLSRLLVDAQIVKRSKQGRSYVVGQGPDYDLFIQFLDENPDYGTRLKGSMEQDAVRARALDHIDQRGSVRSTKDQRIPPAAYKKLIEMVREGELDLIFVKPELKAGVKYDGQTVLSTPLD